MTHPTEQTEIDTKAFRRALGNFATGVTIITAKAPDGTKVGVTASSFNSLSLDPPLVLWSCIKESRGAAIFETAAHFAVNILASDQMDMSNHFARQQEDKFATVEWEEGIGGVPIFPGCAGRFQCETYEKFDGGDHWIFVGKVVAFDDFGRSPLCFHQGSYAYLYSPPDASPKPGQDIFGSAEKGRMGNHAFFLMLRAVRAYQDRYQPKLVTLGLSLIESRILLVLNDLQAATAEELVVFLNAPITEANAALLNLADRGFLTPEGTRYRLTDAGQSKATACWDLAEAHAEETFEGFSQDKVDAFTDVLRQLIAQGPGGTG